MRVLAILANPVETSFGAALFKAAVEALKEAGHEVDECDLYAEEFQPVLTREERLNYKKIPENRKHVAGYVERLQAADGLFICFPVWVSGPPAILKGFFDRILLPGVAFEIRPDGKVVGSLTNIRKITAVATYGNNWWKVLASGDPARKILTRYILGYTNFKASVRYIAQYKMNTMTEQRGRQFIEKVRQEMLRF